MKYIQRVEIEVEYDPETEEPPENWNWSELTGNACVVMDAGPVTAVIEGDK